MNPLSQDTTYSLSIGNSTVLSGDILNAGIIGTVILLIIIFALIYLWHHLKENARLKYEFITIVAHKFRTPLTYVKWITDAWGSEEADPFKKKSLEDIKTSNQKLIDLTGTLIELADSDSSKSATYAIERISLCELVQNISTTLKDSYHEKNIFFSVKCPEENVMVKVDRSSLEFALSTIMENARNYTSPGKNVQVSVIRKFRKAIVTVEDDGIGISKNDLPHIFSKFFRGDNARKNDSDGFGVGLYLANSIVTRLHGKIEAYSPGEGQGSRFTVTLPRVR